MYPNYKCYYSIVLQGFADGQYRFIAIDTGTYGQQSGSRIFHQNSMYHLLNSNNFNMPNDKEVLLSDVKLLLVIVGDEVYLLLYLRGYIPKESSQSLKEYLITV